MHFEVNKTFWKFRVNRGLPSDWEKVKMVHGILFETKRLHLFSRRFTVGINEHIEQMTLSPLEHAPFGLKCHPHFHFSLAFVRKSSKDARCFGWEPLKHPIWPINLWLPSHQIFWNIQEGIYTLINSFLPFNIWVQKSVIPKKHLCELFYCHLLKLWWLSVKEQVTLFYAAILFKRQKDSTSRHPTTLI